MPACTHREPPDQERAEALGQLRVRFSRVLDRAICIFCGVHLIKTGDRGRGMDGGGRIALNALCRRLCHAGAEKRLEDAQGRLFDEQ